MTDSKYLELIDAVRDSEAERTKALLEEGANPNIRTPSGRSMLEIALLNDDLTILKLLVEHGANIKSRGLDGHTILQHSMRYGNVEAARYLIEKGAAFRVKQDIGTSLLINAVHQNDKKLLELFIKAGVDINSVSARVPLLIEAIRSKDIAMVSFFLDNGADPNAKTYAGETCLMKAVFQKSYDIAKLLIERGADPNRGEHFIYPLTLAASHDSVEMFKYLLDKGARIDAVECFEDSFKYVKNTAGPAVAAFLEGEYMVKYKNNEKKYSKFNPIKITDINFQNVIGMDSVKSELRRDIIYHLKHADLAKEYHIALKGGIMFYGPPGCGKTFITKALAGEAGVNMIEASVSDIYDMWVGSEAKAMKRLFAIARRSSPCILFFDEMELLGGNRESAGKNIWAREALNVFLTEMDGASSNNEGLLVIGATNAPWMVDPALKRNGRLGKFIYVPPPDQSAREGMFKIYLKDRPLGKNINYQRLAKESIECSAADIPVICNEAAKLAWEDSILSGSKRGITMKDLDCSLKKETYNMKEWFANAKQHMATDLNRSIYSGLNDSILENESITKAESYR